MSLWGFRGSHGFIPDPDIFGKLEKQWGELKLSLHFHIIDECGEWKRNLLKISNWKVGIFVEDLTVSQSVSLQAGRLLGYFIKWKKS